MVIVIDGQQYQIASYYGASITQREIIGDIYYLVIKQHQYRIEFKIKTGLTYTLDAPENGIMLRNVKESLLGQVEMKIYEHQQCKENLLFDHCGIENDNFFV